VIGFLEKALAHYKHKDTILVSFTGGEPAIWPDFERLCDYLAQRGISIGMTTNATVSPKFYEKTKNMYNFVSVSYHPEYERAERVLQNIATLSGHCNLGVRIMAPPQKKLWDRAVAFRESLLNSDYKLRLTVEFVRLVGGFGTKDTYPIRYSAEQEDFLEDNQTEFVLKGDVPPVEPCVISSDGMTQNGDVFRLHPTDLVNLGYAHFKGWDCHIGLDQLFINERGLIWRAGCQVGGEIGHIFDENIQFPTKPILCNKGFCHCTTDIVTKKTKPTQSTGMPLST
ncbi:MAG: hypothetical protein AAF203_00595, partial [Pseudomonadota bacterium]